MNLEEAADYFQQIYLENSLIERKPLMTDIFFAPNHPLKTGRIPRSRFYCGITNNLERRMDEHNTTPLAWVKSSIVKAAIDLEDKLGEMGFDIGRNSGNGATDDSVYVYIYKKIPGGTKE
ncbi:MAG: hypothetical protein NC453_11255 [Muribaculum sp.]|nr:hypothetical protein [Muribaculum sp.]